MTTTKPRCKYQVGQTVEIETFDFSTPGMPRVWAVATVESVTLAESGKTFEVQVRMPQGQPKVETVGVRGGNKRIRAAA